MKTKRLYNKPEIVFEDFSLSTNIALGCDVKTHTPAAEKCGLEVVTGKFVFISELTGCNYTAGVTPEGIYNGICYDVPTESNDLFNS